MKIRILLNREVCEVIGSVLDISSFRSIEELLKSNEEQLELLFQNSNDQLYIADTFGNIIHANKKARDFIGVSDWEDIKIPWQDLFGEEFNARYRTYIEEAFRGKSQNFDTKIKHKNGKTYYFNVTLLPYFNNGRISEVIAIVKDITEQKELQLRYEYWAYHDELTNLLNRRWIHQKLNGFIKQSNNQLALIIVDIDRFKTINDTLGHNTGDCLIQMFAQRLENVFNQEKYRIGRLGGDEFFIVLPEITSEDEIHKLVLNLLQSINIPFYIDGHEIHITCSIGISLYPDHGKDFTTLFKKADIALYKSKEIGRDMYQFYNPSMDKKNYDRFILERDLRKAIKNNEFVAYYQPKVDARTGKVIGAESLIRWIHPKFGLISPMEFIPLAEETGLIIQIGKWMKRTVCKQLVHWREKGIPLIPICVNISPQRMLQAFFAEEVKMLLDYYKLEGNWLRFEITEISLMKHDETISANLKALKELGIIIYIDDFGTGYSSFNYLQQYKFDGIKIDRSFIKDISPDSEKAGIVSAIISMAKMLNLEVIAEGVETKKELDFLLSQNCTKIQGYYFGKPCPIEEFEAKYMKNSE